MSDVTLFGGLRQVAESLGAAGQRFALVGGMAVAVRGEPRFTRDVDLVVAVPGDREMEALLFELRGAGFEIIALVEHEARGRLATARLVGPGDLIVDLIAATCGIEEEIVSRATAVTLPEVGDLPVARTEELLAMKVLSMTDKRPQDRNDAINLVLINTALDVDAVWANLRLITARGFHRDQDLLAKFESVLEAARQA